MNSVKPWIDTAGKFAVEHIPCPHFNQPVNLAGPRTGVIHTTEGHWDDGLAVFKQHFAPHFLVGAGRIAQLVQIGGIGAALVHHNPDAIVQIEVVGFSKQELWMPDEPTSQALAALMAVCQREYGIPLTHPWADGDYGLYGDNPHRHAGKWGVIAGWYGHGDVPSPDAHWDPGALQWSKLFALANGMTDILHLPGWTPPSAPARPCVACSVAPEAALPSAPPADGLARRKWIQAWLNSHGAAPVIDTDGDLGDKSTKAIADFLAKLPAA